MSFPEPVNINPVKMTKTERINYNHAVDALRMIEHDIHRTLLDQRVIPMEWHEIAADRDKRDAKRTRCTVSFDADVVKFFKGMGPGYQNRMNRVLRAWMHLRLAKIVKGPDVNDYVLRPEVVAKKMRERNPSWGDMDEMMGEPDWIGPDEQVNHENMTDLID